MVILKHLCLIVWPKITLLKYTKGNSLNCIRNCAANRLGWRWQIMQMDSGVVLLSPSYCERIWQKEIQAKYRKCKWVCIYWCITKPAVNWPRQGTDLFGTEIREWQGYHYYPRTASSQFSIDRASVPLCMEQMVMLQTARPRIYRKRNRMSHTSDSLSCKLHSRSHMNHMKLHRENRRSRKLLWNVPASSIFSTLNSPLTTNLISAVRYWT